MALRLSGLQRAVGRMLRLRVREPADKAFYIFNHMVVTHEEGAALVQAFRDDIQNTILPSLALPPACSASRAIGLHSYSRRSFLPGGWQCLGTGRSAFQQIAMEVGNQRANVARGVRALG